MSIQCPRCSTVLPADANYCLKCGQPQKPGLAGGQSTPPSFSSIRWEYKDLVIPLNVDVGSSGDYWAKASAICDPIILMRLQQEGQQGWQADESVALLSLARANHLDTKDTAMGFKFHIGTARIRLKRAI